MKNTDDFHYEGKPSCATTKWTLLTVSKDEWEPKDDTGKPMKNALSQSDIEQRKNQARSLSHYRVTFV